MHKSKEQRVAYAKVYYEENKAEILAKRREYRAKNRDKRAAYKIAYRDANPEKVARSARAANLRRNYNISIEEAERILAYPCEICGKRAACIDHDHVTKKVRGGLCRKCNVGLGIFQDNAVGVRRALRYLTPKVRHRKFIGVRV